MASWGKKMLLASLEKTNKQENQNLGESDSESEIDNEEADPDYQMSEGDGTSDGSTPSRHTLKTDLCEDTNDSQDSIVFPYLPSLVQQDDPCDAAGPSNSMEPLLKATSKLCSKEKEVNPTVNPNSQSRAGPGKPKRMCKFCEQWQTHLTRHLRRKHAGEEEVALALKLPQKEQERAFASIRKGGIFKANAEIRRTDKKATLIRERRQGCADTVMCTGCLGFYDAKNIFRHKSVCSRQMSQQADTVKMTELSASANELNVDNDFKQNVLDRFRNDKVGEICRNDLVTILLGKKLWAKSVKKERSIIMAEMRLMSNLISSFRNESKNENASGIDVLNYRQFDVLETVIKQLSEKEDGQEKAGLKVRIGFVLKKAVKAMRGYFVVRGEFEKETELCRFINVLDLNWNFIFYSAQVECEQKRGGLRKPSSMPVEDDISTFRAYLLKEIEKQLNLYEFWDKHNFVNMRNLILARLTMFNARRGGEPARLTLTEWREAVAGAWMDQNLVETIDDPMEKYLLDNLKLAYQAGKGSRKLVPVLFPKDTIEPLTKLLAERDNCSVSQENPFLFPNTGNSTDHASGYHCLKSVVNNCPNLKRPHLLIADKFRHRVSTLFAQLELPEEQRAIFYRHMGHSESINKNVYQCPLAVSEITRVGGFLLNTVDTHTRPQQNLNKQGENLTELKKSHAQAQTSELAGITTQKNPPEAQETVTIPSVQDHTDACCAEKETKPQKAMAKRRYTKWSVQDSKIVETYFKSFITDTTNKGQLPSKAEILEFLSKNQILEGHNNRADLVRTKVFNEKAKFRKIFHKS